MKRSVNHLATIGFEKIIFGVTEGEDGTITELVADKAGGGAIDATISGLGANQEIIYASNIPFYVSSQGVGDVKISLNVFDITHAGIYNKILGVETVEGVNVVGESTQAPYTGVVLTTKSSNGKRLFLGLAKTRFAHPDIAVGTNEAGSTKVNTDTIEGSCISDARGYVYMSAVESDTMTEAKFKQFVFNQVGA